MKFTYWVTEDCNLRCKYCYVSKAPKTMNRETAAKAIDFTEKKLAANPLEHKDEIRIALHGGEPLLNYPIIHYLVEELKQKNHGEISFTMTTNGTIYNEEMLDYVSKNIQLTVSLDGKQESHDINRVYRNGKGSFNRVIETLDYINHQSHSFRVRMTVTPNNVSYFADNYIFLSEKGYPIVTFAMDESDSNWNKDLMKVYQSNLNEIFSYMVNNNLTKAQYFLYNFKNEHFRPRGVCDGCHNSFHISSEGKIYPCILAVGHGEFSMGDVFSDIIEQRLSNLDVINQKNQGACTKCAMYNNCRSKMCKIINKIQTGNYYESSPIFCATQRIHYSIVKEYEYILKNFEFLLSTH
ncbi:radical SAM/SPASM domain-containing protein [Paenibacillus ottowii]|uniref:Radical SAM protein n=1 Tax=Paenibacillus ottowii TaxID=2315729 RepID=A0ABY3B048_9BACL|nr:radical SAM protein [Paenibacillus ottowii]TQR97040.1 radical SAM protein [Paenibacillus ottowii]